MSDKNKQSRYHMDKSIVNSVSKKLGKLNGNMRGTGEIMGVIKNEKKKPCANMDVELASYGYLAKIWATDGTHKEAKKHIEGVNQLERFVLETARKWTKEREEEGRRFSQQLA